MLIFKVSVDLAWLKSMLLGSCINSICCTTNAINTRAQQHRFKPSKIHAHLENEHQISKVGDIKHCFKTLYRSDNLCDLKIAEALLIKSHLPEINIKYNEMSNNLLIF